MKLTGFKHFLARLRWLISRYKKRILIIGSAIILVAAATVAYFVFAVNKDGEPPSVEQAIEEPEPITYYSPLTGEKVKNEAAAKQLATAIIIENSPEARPQSGLKDSGVIFEAIAEGGITRFLVLYQQEKPQLIGPVRSLRMYYVDWLVPFDASVAHIGGSAAALSEIRNGKHRDIDQFFNPQAYWRSTDRWAPHNVYTSFKKLDALNKSKGFKTSDIKGFSRIDEEPSKSPTTTKINVNFSSALFNSSYQYNAKTNSYKRSQGGTPHLDREAGQISPKVVVVLRVNERTVMEDGYRQSIDTVGSGKAIIFQNGTAQEVTWRKASRASQIKFTDKNGEDVPLARGQTWIAAVPNDTGSVSWQ